MTDPNEAAQVRKLVDKIIAGVEQASLSDGTKIVAESVSSGLFLTSDEELPRALASLAEIGMQIQERIVRSVAYYGNLPH